MKKTFSIFAILAIATITMFTSCSSDDDDGIKESDVYGTWVTIAVQTKSGNWTDLTDSRYENLRAYAQFFSNGKYKGWGALGNGSGTWKMSGKTVITYLSTGDEYISYNVSSVSGDIMTGTMSDGKTSLTFKAQRTSKDAEYYTFTGRWLLTGKNDDPASLYSISYSIIGKQYITISGDGKVTPEGDAEIEPNGNYYQRYSSPFSSYTDWKYTPTSITYDGIVSFSPGKQKYGVEFVSSSEMRLWEDGSYTKTYYTLKKN